MHGIENPQTRSPPPGTVVWKWGGGRPGASSLSLAALWQEPSLLRRLGAPRSGPLVQLLKQLSVGSSNGIMGIWKSASSVFTYWDLKSAKYLRKWCGCLQHWESLCLMTRLLSGAIRRHLSQFPASARIFSRSVRVPLQLSIASQLSPSGAFSPVERHEELKGYWVTASKTLKSPRW